METKSGFGMVFRGNESLGNVRYRFMIDGDRVTGSVEHVDYVVFPKIIGGVPATFRAQAINAIDLQMSLRDGTAVSFVVVDKDGRIENGRRYKEVP